jgi:isocitrate/isopropylmalate dehydrogenase
MQTKEEKLDIIKQAILQKKSLSLNYINRNNEISSKMFCPHLLGLYRLDNQWVCIGWQLFSKKQGEPLEQERGWRTFYVESTADSSRMDCVRIHTSDWVLGEDYNPAKEALKFYEETLVRMTKYKIAWLPGDGVGNEVMEAARIVLDKLGLDAEYIHGDIGWEFWKSEGNALPDRTIEVLKNTTCALFGAITSKPREEADAELDPALKGKGFDYFSPIVKLRQMFDLHTNLRPCKTYPGNPLNFKEGIDLVIFRENTEGMYGGVEFYPLPQSVYDALSAAHPKMKRFGAAGLENIALSTRIMTRQGCARIVKAAFEYAKKENYKTVTVCDKPNVLRETGGLMIRTAREVAKEYPGIELWETNIDAQCMWLLKNPMDYGVIVAENMFGDILSDLAAQLVGGLGFAAAGNIGDKYAVFEPTHGSAPKYYGQYKVNPLATIVAAKLMLEWLGERAMAEKLDKAVAAVIKEGKARTYDMGGKTKTLEMAEAVVEKL